MADQKSQAALFQVYLRLRPPPSNQQIATERFLSVEEPANADDLPTHITLNPPNDNRRRAVEKFAFTTVFEEEATQLDLFHGTGVLPLVEGVLGPQGGDGRDGLLATLGVTGSGKVHKGPSILSIDRFSFNTESYNSRISNPARSHPTCPRCTLPIDFESHT
jgi:hypothetical protein